MNVKVQFFRCSIEEKEQVTYIIKSTRSTYLRSLDLLYPGYKLPWDDTWIVNIIPD